MKGLQKGWKYLSQDFSQSEGPLLKAFHEGIIDAKQFKPDDVMIVQVSKEKRAVACRIAAIKGKRRRTQDDVKTLTQIFVPGENNPRNSKVKRVA